MNQRMLIQAGACLALLVAVYGLPRKATRLHGRVTFAGENRLVLHTAGQDLMCFPEGEISVALDGQPASLEALQPGDYATVYASRKGGIWIMKSVAAATCRLDESFQLLRLESALNNR